MTEDWEDQPNPEIIEHNKKYEADWPNYCRKCGGRGGFGYYDNHGVPGPGEYVEDVCGACEGNCPRCGALWDREDEEISRPCVKCGFEFGKTEGLVEW